MKTGVGSQQKQRAPKKRLTMSAEQMRSFKKRFKETRALYWFIIPGLLFYLLFKYYPIYGSQIAFRDYSPYLGFFESPWVGLKHFERFFNSPDFWNITKNTLVINVANLIFGFPFPIILAIMLNQLAGQKFKKFVQTVTYAPYFISMVVMVGMMFTMLSPFSGVVNTVVKMFGGEAIFFMAEKDMYVPIYVISGIWQNCGWSSVVYIAALSSVSTELHEAAMVDGASRMQRIWHIDLPSIMPTIVTMLILNAGQLLSIGFEKSFLMQNAINIDVSEVISTYTYKRGLIGGDFSYASAIEMLQAGINFIILLVVNKVSKKVNETSLW